MRIKLIVQEPKYQINIGYIARTAKNFGVTNVCFVRPRANITGKKALMFAKHAASVLRDAKIYKSIEDATRDCGVIVGTTGIWRKAQSGNKNAMLADDAAMLLAKKPGTRIGIILGRDDYGMKKEELEKCDMIVHVPASAEYPVLNISHALAILLYELTKADNSAGMLANVKRARAPKKAELRRLLAEFDKMISHKKIRNKKVVSRVFRKLITGANLDEKETHALITALK
ncbi:MAG: RNA methyltransferase [Candidatus Micrarchaeia archaeon]